MKVAELFAYLGIVTDEKKAKDFFNVLEGGKQVLFGLAAAAVGTSLSIGAMLNKAVQTSLALAHFEAETGLSAQTLQEWQHVGEGLGLTVDEVTSSIAGLNDQLTEVKLTGQGAAPYSRLGLNPLEMENAWDVLEQLRKIIKSGDVPPQLMSKLIKQMGLSGAMVKVLKLTNKEFDIMANRGAIISQDQIDKALEFNAAIRRIGQTITYLFTVAFAELQPQIMGLLEGLVGWIKENRSDIIKTVKDIAKVGVDIAEDVGKAFAAIDGVIKRTVGWEAAIKGVVAAFALLNPTLRLLWLAAEALTIIDYFMTKKGTMGERAKKFMLEEKLPWYTKTLGAPTAGGLMFGEWLGKKSLELEKGLLGPPPDIYPTQGGVRLQLAGGGGNTIYKTYYIQSNAESNEEVARLIDEKDEKKLGDAYAGIPD